MLWYSTNSKPLKHRKDEISLQWNPKYISTKIDLHLVWTKFDLTFLESLGIQNVHAVGSILFQPRLIAKRDREKFVITFFDVTPYLQSVVSKLGNSANFYSEENGINDLTEFVDIAIHLKSIFRNKINIRIKPKRAYGPLHSQLYQQKIGQLTEVVGIEQLDPYSNLYLTVSESDLVLSTPWSSPCVLAKELQVDSAYFSFRGDEWDLPTEYEEIKVIQSPKELTAHLLTKIQNKFEMNN
jgi:polysaccharide biosynthesis PFTS motif protein